MVRFVDRLSSVIYIYIYIYKHINVSMNTYIHEHINIYTHTHTNIHTHTHTHTHTNTHTLSFGDLVHPHRVRSREEVCKQRVAITLSREGEVGRGGHL